MIIRELFVALGANTDKAAVDAFKDSLSDVKREGKDVVKFLGVLTASAAGAAFGVWKLVRQVSEAADEAHNHSQRMGMSAEAYQELSYAADQADTSIRALRGAYRRLSVKAVEASRIGGEQAEMFSQMGIDIHGAAGEIRSADDLMMDVADHIASIGNESEQTAAAVALFSNRGEQILPFLRKGRDGIREMREEAHEFNGVLGQDTVEGFADLQDNVTRTRRVLEGWRNTLVVSLLPRINEVIERILEWAGANDDIIRSKIESFADRLADGILRIADIAAAVNEEVEKWGGWSAIFEQATKGMVGLGAATLVTDIIEFIMALKSAWVALGGVVAAVGGTTIAIIVAVLMVVLQWVLLIEDFIGFLRGDDSVTGQLLDFLGIGEDVKSVFREIGSVFKELGQLFDPLQRIAAATVDILVQLFSWLFESWLDDAGPTFEFLMALFGLFVTVIGEGLKFLIRDFAALLTGIADLLETFAADPSAFVDTVKGWFTSIADVWRESWQSVIDWIMDKLEAVLSTIGQVTDAIPDIPGIDIARAGVDLFGKARNSAGNVASRISSAFAPAADNNVRPGGNSSVNTGTVHVNVDASNARDPEAVGDQTANKTEDALWRVLRQTDAALAGGEA